MFVVNEDNSIYATRGDIVFFKVCAEDNGARYDFKAGDVLRLKIYGKKDAESVYLQKDFPVAANTSEVEIYLTEEDTKIGEVISKPKDYWYEVELNPNEEPQTIIGYNEDGPVVFKLFPEGADIEAYEPSEEDFPVVDEELDLSSPRPVSNRVIARAFANLEAGYEETKKAVAEKGVTPQMYGAVGDGYVDDTEAFRLAVASSNTVSVPAGKYLLSDTIEIPAYVRVEGISANSEGGTVIKKENYGAAFKLNSYAEISNMYIDGTKAGSGIELSGGRVFAHDLTIQNCVNGISNNEVSSNLSRVSRVTILDSETAIYLSNENGSNSQSLSFYDVDVRGCEYGLITHQPGNKFVNFCVQNGIKGGYAIILNAGANNNEFVGTYLENANYTSEVDFTTSQYNRFTGGRPLQYGNSFVNNDGTNIVLTRSIQYNAMFERGTVVHEKVGVIAKETDAGLPSAVVTAKNNGDNKVLVETLGTSVPTTVDFQNVIVREDNLTHAIGSRKFKGFGMMKYIQSVETVKNGEFGALFTSGIGEGDIAFVQCETAGIHASIRAVENGQHKISFINDSGGDISGELVFNIIFAQSL